MDQRELAEVGILGTLREDSPATLAEVQDRLRNNFARYWTYGHGVIAPARDRLLEAGQVAAADGGGPEAYEITDAGVSRLQEILRQPVEPGVLIDVGQRHQLVVRIGFLHHLPAADQADVLAEMEDHLHDDRERWTGAITGEGAGPDGRGYRGDMADLIVRIIDCHIEWLDTVKPPAAAE